MGGQRNTNKARLDLLEKARHRAYAIIDENSALSDEYFAQLQGLDADEEDLVEKLAREFVTDAADYVDIEENEDEEEDEDEETDDLDIGEDEDEEW